MGVWPDKMIAPEGVWPDGGRRGCFIKACQMFWLPVSGRFIDGNAPVAEGGGVQGSRSSASWAANSAGLPQLFSGLSPYSSAGLIGRTLELPPSTCSSRGLQPISSQHQTKQCESTTTLQTCKPLASRHELSTEYRSALC